MICARIFTAYGPRQRPDLAIRKFADRLLAGKSLPVFGDGSAQRDFTYIDDLVEGLVRAIDRDLGFALLNFAGGRTVNLRDMQSMVFTAGASALMVGNYLTTLNQPVEKDLQMLKDLGLDPNWDDHGFADQQDPAGCKCEPVGCEAN